MTSGCWKFMGHGMLMASLLVIPLRNGPAVVAGAEPHARPSAVRTDLLRATTAWLARPELASRGPALLAPVPLGLRN